MVPYLIVGTPRSRTAWLAQFLSTPTRRCLHEPSLRWEYPSDLLDWLADDASAASDCMMTFLAPKAKELRSDIKVAVVLRDVDEVHASLFNVGLDIPRAYVEMMNRKAREVACWADIAVRFEALENGHVVRELSRCLTGDFDEPKWRGMRTMNVQSNALETIHLLHERNDIHARLYGPYYD